MPKPHTTHTPDHVRSHIGMTGVDPAHAPGKRHIALDAIRTTTPAKSKTRPRMPVSRSTGVRRATQRSR